LLLRNRDATTPEFPGAAAAGSWRTTRWLSIPDSTGAWFSLRPRGALPGPKSCRTLLPDGSGRWLLPPSGGGAGVSEWSCMC